MIQFVKNSCISEGVWRENHVITIPRPQDYHKFCQVCNINYESFDEHI